MLHEELVSFETAKVLKTTGFNLYTSNSYWRGELTHITPGYPLDNGETSQGNYFDFERYYAPTQSQLQRWLREYHSIHITVWYSIVEESYNGHAYHEVKKDLESDVIYQPSYEVALEETLMEALKLINADDRVN
jgi:hypothetical protein